MIFLYPLKGNLRLSSAAFFRSENVGEFQLAVTLQHAEYQNEHRHANRFGREPKETMEGEAEGEGEEEGEREN